MACFITITRVVGVADSDGNLIEVKVEGTASEKCERVNVEGMCAKPFVGAGDVTYSDGNPVGTWEATLTPPPDAGGKCKCLDTHIFRARCSAPADVVGQCERANWQGVLGCEIGPTCPDVVIHVYQGSEDITDAILFTQCVGPGDYRVYIETTIPGSSIALDLEVNGVEIVPETDPRVSGLAADNSEFTFSLAADEILEVQATTWAADCVPKPDGVILKGCKGICDSLCEYNPITEDCCPQGQCFNPDTGGCEDTADKCPPERLKPDGTCCAEGTVVSNGECCPPGTNYNPDTKRCETDCPDGQERNPVTDECCPPNTRFEPRTGRCVARDDCPPERRRPDGGCCPPGTRFDLRRNACVQITVEEPPPPFCDCGPWWCWSLFGLLALVTFLIILGAANCFTIDSPAIIAALEALSAGGADPALALAVLEAIGIGAFATTVWRVCGPCCVACALWLGLIAAVIVIILQWIFSSLPPCIWPGGVLVAIGVIIVASMFTTACNSGE